MAFTGSTICYPFHLDLGLARINTASDVFKVALYDGTAALNEATASYTTTGELPTAGGYTAGGATVTITVSTAATSSGTSVIWTFTNAVWAAATFTARGALLYDSTPAAKTAIAVMDFGANISVTAGTFTVTMPAATANTAIIVFPRSVLTS